MTNKNWKNSKTYLSNYYNEVIKPKRQKAQEERKKALQQQFADTLVVQRVCPICGKSWEETLTWKPNRKPSVKKQCPECIKAKQKQYTQNPKVKARINQKRRTNYAENELVRQRVKLATQKWKQSTLDN